MDSEILEFVIQTIISLSGVLMAALLATYFAMKRFREEKWWQRKAEIYSELINELHELKYPKVRFFDSLVEGIKIDDDEAHELIRLEKDAQIKLLQVAEKSSFFLNESVLFEIRNMDKFINRAKNQESVIEQYQDEIYAIDECISRVMSIGRKDLQINERA